MKAKFRLDTPEGSFPVFSNQVRPNLCAATVIYYKKGLEVQTAKESGFIEADLHMEEGATEVQALERLKAWCFTQFGEPCVFAKAA